MDYPIDSADVTGGVRQLLAADALTRGAVPGFEVVSTIAPGAVRLGVRQESTIEVSSLSAANYDDIHDLLDQKAGEEFVTNTAIRMLSGAESLTPVMQPQWDYSRLLGEFRVRPAAVIFPWWRAAVGSLPKIDGVLVTGSRGVGKNEVIWVAGGKGQFVLNDSGGFRYGGSESEVVLAADVWRLGPERPRICQIQLLEDTLVGV